VSVRQLGTTTAGPPRVNAPVIERAPTSTDRPVVTTPSPTTTERSQRRPSDVSPSAITSAIPAETNYETKQPLTQSAPAPVSPLKTTLVPKQVMSPASSTGQISPSPERATGVNLGEAALNPADRSAATVVEAISEPSGGATPRQPAALGKVPTTGSVAKPEFPNVNDDPFTPLTSPSPAPGAAETHGDDPFAPLPATPATSDKPADSLVIEPTLKKIDMLAPGADGRLPLREWTDDSGKFTVRAQLVLVLDGKVRLLKETGRTTTVALGRLSKDDRSYVAEAIQRYGEDLAKLHQLASR